MARPSSTMTTIGPILIDAPARREIASGIGSFRYGSRAVFDALGDPGENLLHALRHSALPPGHPAHATGCNLVIMPLRISAATGKLSPGTSRVPISMVAFRTFASARVSRYFVDSNGRNAARYTLIRGGTSIVARSRRLLTVRGLGMAGSGQTVRCRKLVVSGQVRSA
jgi:hypothetical protein